MEIKAQMLVTKSNKETEEPEIKVAPRDELWGYLECVGC